MRTLLPLLLVGCTPSTPLPGDCADGPCLFVASTLAAPAPDGGLSYGVDVDGEDDACGKSDFVHPVSGATSIDNGLAGLLPVIEVGLGESVKDAFQTEINRGGLTMLFGLDAAHVDDDAATFTLYRGLVPGGGAPSVEDGVLVSGQTFDLDNSSLPPVEVPAVLEGGILEAQLPEIRLTAGVPGGLLEVVILSPVFRATVVPGGLVDGEIAGALFVDQLVAGLAPFAEDVIEVSVLEGLFLEAADLQGADGSCDALSLAFTFEALIAHPGETL